MTKANIRKWKNLVIADVNRILQDYLMDENETAADIRMNFWRGKVHQEKHLVWTLPGKRTKVIGAIRLSDLSFGIDRGSLLAKIVHSKELMGLEKMYLEELVSNDIKQPIDELLPKAAWIPNVGAPSQCGVHCSNCGFSAKAYISCHFTKFRRCPECGIRMNGVAKYNPSTGKMEVCDHVDPSNS